MDDSLLKVLSRIKCTQDGNDFIEYLRELSEDNYEAFKKDHFDNDRVHKGYGIAIDGIIKLFETCDDILEKRRVADIAQKEVIGEFT